MNKSWILKSNATLSKFEVMQNCNFSPNPFLRLTLAVLTSFSLNPLSRLTLTVLISILCHSFIKVVPGCCPNPLLRLTPAWYYSLFFPNPSGRVLLSCNKKDRYNCVNGGRIKMYIFYMVYPYTSTLVLINLRPYLGNIFLLMFTEFFLI